MNIYIPTHSLLSSSCAHQLTLYMLASWSHEGVVFLVLLSSSHLTTYHVFSLSLSGANWRSLFPPWGSGPPFPKMAPSFTGSAHTPSPGVQNNKCSSVWIRRHLEHNQTSKLQDIKYYKMSVVTSMRCTEKYKPLPTHGPHLPAEQRLRWEPVHGRSGWPLVVHVATLLHTPLWVDCPPETE